MTLSTETMQEIEAMVRGGFESRDRIIEIFCEEMYEPGELESSAVAAAVDVALSDLKADMPTWPALTDCDKLDKVFAALNQRGIISLQNAGYTQSDGFHDVSDKYVRSGRKDVVGYCFYHGQDLERAVAGDGLYLAFGPFDPDDETTEGPKVGTMIVEELGQQGFAVEWNGTFSERILVCSIDWKRRPVSMVDFNLESSPKSWWKLWRT